MEATTTASAVTYGLLKFILGHTIAAAVASAVGFFVITPRTVREAMVRIVSTLFASFIVGPIVVAYFHVHYPLLFEAAAKQASAEGLTGVGEMYVSWPIVVLCGLPAWWVVGWVLRWFDNRRDKDLGQVVAEGWLGSYTVTFLDGYFVFVKPASQQIYISQPYSDPIEIDPLDFASAEGAPDNVMAAIGLKRQLWCFGSYTTEVWYDSGNADFPFQPIQGAFNQYGLLAPWSLALMDDTFFWLGRNDAGSTIVYCCEGFNARRISTDAVEQAMQGYPNPQNAVAYAYNQGGRSVYVINFPEANSTWAYDNTTGAWHERQYLNPISGKAERARAQYHIAAFNKHIVSDYADGRLYEMDLDTFSDDGDPIVRMRQSPHMAGPELERISYQEFQLDCQTGVGTPGILS